MKTGQKHWTSFAIAILAVAALCAGSSLFLLGSAPSSQALTSDNSLNVGIVSGASGRTTDAFQPNPVQITVGQKVVWTNDDSAPHTITSGEAATPDGKFDSSPNFNPLLAPGQTFSHTFEKAGKYPYFCQLHPNMVGTVIVAASVQNNDKPSSDNNSSAIQQLGNISQGQLTLQKAKEMYLSAWNNTKFNATFSAYIEENSALGYGVYQEHAGGNTFRPGETMVLYVEPVGFGHKPTIDKLGNTLYLVNITADYIISDNQGRELQRITDLPVGNILSHRQNTELYLELTLAQSTPFPEGDYVITYVLHDKVSGESFNITKNVAVAASRDASSGLQASKPTIPLQPDDNEATDGSKDDSGSSGNSGSSEKDNEMQNNNCDPSYPDVCIPSPPPDLDCSDVSEKNFKVRGSDPHGFDRDNDGIGCES